MMSVQTAVQVAWMAARGCRCYGNGRRRRPTAGPPGARHGQCALRGSAPDTRCSVGARAVRAGPAADRGGVAVHLCIGGERPGRTPGFPNCTGQQRHGELARIPPGIARHGNGGRLPAVSRDPPGLRRTSGCAAPAARATSAHLESPRRLTARATACSAPPSCSTSDRRSPQLGRRAGDVGPARWPVVRGGRHRRRAVRRRPTADPPVGRPCAGVGLGPVGRNGADRV